MLARSILQLKESIGMNNPFETIFYHLEMCMGGIKSIDKYMKWKGG